MSVEQTTIYLPGFLGAKQSVLATESRMGLNGSCSPSLEGWVDWERGCWDKRGFIFPPCLHPGQAQSKNHHLRGKKKKKITREAKIIGEVSAALLQRGGKNNGPVQVFKGQRIERKERRSPWQSHFSPPQQRENITMGR